MWNYMKILKLKQGQNQLYKLGDQKFLMNFLLKNARE